MHEKFVFILREVPVKYGTFTPKCVKLGKSDVMIYLLFVLVL